VPGPASLRAAAFDKTADHSGILMTRFPGELVNPRRRPPPGTSATTATSAQSRVRSTALARGLGPALVSAAAEDDRVGGAELLSDQLAQLIVA
jgi:hypothetical protein